MARLKRSRTATNVARRSQRILLVEDDEVDQMVAAGMLEQHGFRADVAADGRQALDALAREDYAVVLMDCQMPELDGYQATAEIRRREGTQRRTPIIAMTAHALKGDREKCVAAGIDDYLSKPLSAHALSAILDRWAPAEAPAVADRRSAADRSAARDLLDHAQIAQLRAAIGPEGLLAVIDTFESDSPNQTSDIAEAVRAGDAPALQAAAHALKGAAANLGAAHAARLAGRLEELARTDDLERAPALAEELAYAAKQAPVALREAVSR
jgi:two-component system, sensor histidine kinase and response regulator